MLTIEELNRMAEVADPEVDGLVAEAMSANGTATIEEEMLAMVALGRSEGSSIGDYFAAQIDLPEWADHHKLAVAQDFFSNWGLQLAIGLFFGALPRSYTAASSVRALTIVGGLTEQPTRRIAETGQFLIDVMGMDTPGLPLLAGTRGQRATRGVRMFHSIARQWLTADPHRWDSERDGIPIDQEEMLATVLLFSVAALDALDQMGVDYTDEQAEAYVHTWCVAGELMGIGSAGNSPLPLSYSEARELGLFIEAKHSADTPEGRALAKALLDDCVEMVPKGFGWLPRTIMHELASPEVAKVLGVPPGPKLARLFLQTIHRINRVSFKLLRTTPFAAAGAWVGRRIIKNYIARERAERPPWSFEPSLKDWRHRRRQLVTRRHSPHGPLVAQPTADSVLG
jgi:hypothetical protein